MCYGGNYQLLMIHWGKSEEFLLCLLDVKGTIEAQLYFGFLFHWSLILNLLQFLVYNARSSIKEKNVMHFDS